MEVHWVNTEKEVSEVAVISSQLRAQYTQSLLIVQIIKQQKSGCQLANVNSGKDILCVVGFVVGEKLAWGKYIYLDDLVTTKKFSSVKCISSNGLVAYRRGKVIGIR